MAAAAFVITPPPAAGLDGLVPADGHSVLFTGPGGEVAQFQTSVRKGWMFALVEPAVTVNSWQQIFEEGTDHDVWIVEIFTGDRDLTTIWRVNREGRAVITEATDDLTFDYPEGRLDAPAGNPDRWRDSGPVTITGGSRLLEGQFSLVAHAEQDASGCRVTTYDTTITLPDGTSDASQRVETRCPGRGLTEVTDPAGQWAASTDVRPPAPLTAIETDSPPSVPTELVRLDFPDAPDFMDIYEAAEPVGRDRVVMVYEMTQDLYSLDRTGDSLAFGWSAHPGGSITSFATFGEVSVVTTSLRQAVAYDAEGFRVWTAGLPEVCTAGPVRLDDSTMLIGCRDGSLRALDIATGVLSWNYQLPGEVQTEPLVAADGTVVVADLTQTVSAVKDGHLQWEAPLDGVLTSIAMPLNQEHVLVAELGSNTILQFDLATGDRYSAGWVEDAYTLHPMANGALATAFTEVVFVGPGAGLRYSGPIRSITTTSAAALVDTGTEITVVTSRGSQTLGGVDPETSPFSYWRQGDGEWLLTGADGTLWSVR